MTLFELLEARKTEIAQVGERAIAEARRAGVPAAYMDRTLGPGIIRELPDGTRERVVRENGVFVVVERYGQRA